ncbi:MAG: phytoene/squalene synthase family protein [Anaerolineales bacterium]
MLDFTSASSTLVVGQQHHSYSPSSAISVISDAHLARKITREASTQTYITIRILADRPLAPDAYRAYAYFRWVDDIIDAPGMSKDARLAFVRRQQQIIRRCYAGMPHVDLCPEESLVSSLIAGDLDVEGGLHTYISQMMAVMAFDARRKGRLISQLELDIYTLRLSMAVTEALHYFIGHDCASPMNETRYLAVTAAHITHMLRDAVEDAQNGYFNIPRDYLEKHDLSPMDVNNVAYREWVKSRVELARKLFAGGRTNLAKVENVRCRLAGYAYIARFEVVLDAIEKDNYLLRAEYPERKSKRAALQMGTAVLSQIWRSPDRIQSDCQAGPKALRRIAG